MIQQILKPKFQIDIDEIFQLILSEIDWKNSTILCGLNLVPQSGTDTHAVVERVESNGSNPLGSNVTDINDADVLVVDSAQKIRLPFSLTKTISDGLLPSIREYLAKPEILVSGTLTSTDTASTFPFYDCAYPLTTTLKYSKISSVLGIRFTTVVTLQVNATRFQQGAYWLCFLPSGGIKQTGASWNDFYLMHRSHPISVSHLKHAQFNINCDTQAILRIPYVSSTVALAVNANYGVGGFGSPGGFFLYPISVLSSITGALSAPYTIWVHYEDVELFGNTIPQMGKLDIVGKEMDEGKPVSQFLGKFSKATGELAAIPLLSSIAAPVSWVADVLSKSARHMGWSKPTLLTAPIRQLPTPFPYMACGDGADPCLPLSLNMDNHLQIVPGFAGTDLDELSIDFFKAIWSYFDTIPWTTSYGSQTNLAGYVVTPRVFQRQYTETLGSTMTSMTPIALLSNLFDYWRGGLEFRLDFIGTEFHSGRLLVSFYPYETNNSAFVASTWATKSYLHRQIVDIREQRSVTIQVPWISLLPWRPTNLEYETGILSIDVLDPLNAPVTVNPAINVLLYVRGMPDLQFACPSSFDYVPIVPLALQMGDMCDISDTTVGMSQSFDDGVDACVTCIGECISSFRPLLKRGGFINAALGSSNVENDIYPFTWASMRSAAAVGGTPNYDPFNLFCSMYALYRGGMRIKGFSQSATNNTVVAAALANATPAASAISNTQVVVAGSTVARYYWGTAGRNIQVFFANNSGIVVNVPAYHYNHSNATAANMYNDTTTVAFLNTLANFNYIRVASQIVGSGIYNYHRSISDDGSFGGFISIPPMYAVPQQ